MEQALVDMKGQGAEIVDGVDIAEIDQIPLGNLFCNRFKYDITAYLASLGPQAPVKTLDEILASGKFHPSIEKRMRDAQAEPPPERNPSCIVAEESGRRLAKAVQAAMDNAKLDALVYPSWDYPPRLIGDLNTPHGNNSPRISPPTGFPAMTVPMGFVRGNLPAGLQILGRPWSEPVLIRIAYSYEQATRHRHPPASTPPLPLPFTHKWLCTRFSGSGTATRPLVPSATPAAPICSQQRAPRTWLIGPPEDRTHCRIAIISDHSPLDLSRLKRGQLHRNFAV